MPEKNEQLLEEQTSQLLEEADDKPTIKTAVVEVFTNIAKLFKVKSLLTLILTAVFAMLAMRGTIEAQDVMSVFLMVVSFYFGTQSGKKE